MLLEDLEPQALGEVARERALAGSGRTLEAEREAPVGVPDETLGKGGRVGIGLDEPEIEPRRRTLRRLLAPEHPGEAPDPVEHRSDAAAREPRCRRRPGPNPGVASNSHASESTSSLGASMPWRAISRVQIRALTRGVGRRSSSANIIRRRMGSLAKLLGVKPGAVELLLRGF